MVDLVRRDPLRNIFTWPRWLDEFEDIFPTVVRQRGLRIHETDKDIVVEAVVAGVPASNVDIEIEDGIVTVKAEKKEEERGKGEYKASTYQYYYTCALSGGEWDKAEASVKDGVVAITIPKAESARPKKVRVKASGK